MRRFLRGFLIFVLGGLLGAGVGFAAGLFVYPYIFLDDVVANEQVADRDTQPVQARGGFRHANPNDPIHYGKGAVTVFATLVHLEQDFEVGPGPRYHVYLSKKAVIQSSADFDAATALDLGRLKAFRGSQSYDIPAGADLTEYRSVVIWCRAFDVLISPAPLEKVLTDSPPASPAP